MVEGIAIPRATAERLCCELHALERRGRHDTDTIPIPTSTPDADTKAEKQQPEAAL